MITALLSVFMVGFALVAGRIFNKALAYSLTSLVYWCVFCLPLTFYHLGHGDAKSIYAKASGAAKSAEKAALTVLAFVPCLGTLVAVFLPRLTQIPALALAAALFYAVINGTVEELFWRGVFIKFFPNDPVRGWLLPTALFGAWHIALYYIKGMAYQGGFVALAGGATAMGLLWGFVAFRTKSIRVVTIAHIAANFFAFSGMIYDNWFV